MQIWEECYSCKFNNGATAGSEVDNNDEDDDIQESQSYSL